MSQFNFFPHNSHIPFKETYLIYSGILLHVLTFEHKYWIQIHIESQKSAYVCTIGERVGTEGIHGPWYGMPLFVYGKIM